MPRTSSPTSLSKLRDKKRQFFDLIAQGTPIDEAARKVALSVLELAYLLRHDEEFKSLWGAWEEGMSLIMEGKLTEQGMRGRTVAILNFLRAVDPQRWSEKVQVEQMTKQEQTVRILFGWQPPDMPQLEGVDVKRLGNDVVEVEALPSAQGDEDAS